LFINNRTTEEELAAIAGAMPISVEMPDDEMPEEEEEEEEEATDTEEQAVA
jgi:hypothetical protein